MIFRNLYSYLRYKILPPSTLAKNRLFIERDSTKKKVVNDLGSTIRNGKWSNFEKRNIVASFNLHWQRVSYWLLLLVLLWYLPPSGWKDLIYGNVSGTFVYGFWVILDLQDYAILLLIWVSLFITFLARKFLLLFLFKKVESSPLISPTKLEDDLTSEHQTQIAEMYRVFKNIKHKIVNSLRTDKSSLTNPVNFISYDKIGGVFFQKLFSTNSAFQNLPGLFGKFHPIVESPLLTTFLKSGWFTKGQIRIKDSSRFHNYLSSHYSPLQLDTALTSNTSNSNFYSSYLNFNSYPSLNYLMSLGWRLENALRETDRWLRIYCMSHRRMMAYSTLVRESKRGMGESPFKSINFRNNLWLSEFSKNFSIKDLFVMLREEYRLLSNQVRLKLTEGSFSFAGKRIFFFSNLSTNSRQPSFTPKITFYITNDDGSTLPPVKFSKEDDILPTVTEKNLVRFLYQNLRNYVLPPSISDEKINLKLSNNLDFIIDSQLFFDHDSLKDILFLYETDSYTQFLPISNSFIADDEFLEWIESVEFFEEL